MDLELNPMRPETVGLLDQLSAVCRRYGVDYCRASQCQRELMESIALYEFRLRQAHDQGLPRGAVPPFLGLKRSSRSENTPA
mgnify:FL=1